MKTVLLFCIKTYINIGLFFYYKKIVVRKHVPLAKDTPVLFLGNHQNALLDPLLLAVTSGRYIYFLTRAQVFKKPLISKLLKALQLIPVYRVRDGWQNITQNNAVFKDCVSLLNTNNAAITMFPEGSHSLKRNVRPLSKGFTRIVLGLLNENPNSDLLLIPVGFNYKNGEACPDEVLINYGTPLQAVNYKSLDENEAVKMLKADVYKALSRLTTQIPTEDYQNTLNKLIALNANFLEPEKVNKCIESQFKNCEFQSKDQNSLLRLLCKMVLIINYSVPYFIWKKVVQPKIKELEFIATFRFVVAITLVPLWILIMASLLFVFVSGTVAGYYVVFTLIITLLAVKL